MARRLGSIFLDAATVPLGQAGRSLLRGDVSAALAGLGRESLISGVRRGVERAAKAAGTNPLEVYSRLPMVELEEAVEQIETRQLAAAELWRNRPQKAGSDSSAAAGAAADLKEHDVPQRLRHLADRAKHERGDRAVAAAFETLADVLAAWLASLDRCGGLLDAGKDLARAYRRRRWTRLGILTLVPMVLAAAGAWYVQRELARARVDGMIAAGGCAVEDVAERDRAVATPDQLAAIEQQLTVCQEQRVKARREAERQRQAEATRLEQERIEQEKNERCSRLQRNFEADQLDADDVKLLGKQSELYQRLAKGSFQLADVEAELGPLPCEGKPAAAAIGARFARLLAGSASAWLRTRTPSKSVRQLLVAHRAAADEEDLKNLGWHIDNAAARAVRTGQQQDIERFAELCRWKKALQLKQFGNCVAVLDLAAGK